MLTKGRDFSFPIFRNATSPRAATRINQLLQLSELNKLITRSNRGAFEQAEVNDDSIYGGKVWMKTAIHSNSRRVLSIGFEESSCGMTCTYWHRYYNFNPANGDRIDLRDFFTNAGFEEFSKAVAKRRSAKYRREVRQKVEREYQEFYLDTIGCFRNDNLTDYYIRSREIVIDGENCLVKGQKFDGLDMIVRFKLGDFRNYLNAYGRIIFGLSNGPIAKFRSDRLPQLFVGSINGSFPIAMVLNREFGTGLRGMYAYLKFGEGIGLRGNETEAGAKITEYVLSPATEMKAYGPVRTYKENAQISGFLKDGTFEGTWSSRDGSSTFPLRVSKE